MVYDSPVTANMSDSTPKEEPDEKYQALNKSPESGKYNHLQATVNRAFKTTF